MNNKESQPQTIVFKVTGMDCASCVQKIEKVVRDIPGVGEVNVKFSTQRLEVATTENGLEDAVKNRVRQIGFGCENLSEDAHDAQRSNQEVQSAASSVSLKRFVKPVALYAAAVMLGLLFTGVAQWFYAIAALILAVPFLKRAYFLMRAKQFFTIELLMLVASAGAIFLGDGLEAATVVFLFTIGELLEGLAADRARASLSSLKDVLPTEAQRKVRRGFGTERVKVSKLRIGDVVVIKPGDVIPADGIITSGHSHVMQSALTGEPTATPKGPKDEVFAGTINHEGRLEVEVRKLTNASVIAKIVELVTEADTNKTKLSRLIERFSSRYTPSVFLLALAVALLPYFGFGGEPRDYLYRALSLLLIACPCALVLSTPAACAAALASAARQGFLIKGGAALETLGHVEHVIFDKTGTLTTGQMQVAEVFSDAVSREEVLQLVAVVERDSTHPLAHAFENISLPAHLRTEEVVQVPGKGMSALLFGDKLIVGSVEYLHEVARVNPKFLESARAMQQSGLTVVMLAKNGDCIGVVGLLDSLRGDAASSILELKRLGISSSIITGDHRAAASAVCGGLQIEIEAGMLPDDKLRYVTQKCESTTCAMVGDGFNDVPALAAASVGIVVGKASSAALDVGDATVFNGTVSSAVRVIRFGRETLRNIRMNIAITLGLKTFFLVTTLLGVTQLWMAILSDTGATLLVTLNALRLLRYSGSQS